MISDSVVPSDSKQLSQTLLVESIANILLMDNKHRKLFVLRQSKGCIFIPKMLKIRLAAGLRPGPLGERISRIGGGYLGVAG